DLQEARIVPDDLLTHLVANRPIRRDRRRDGDDPVPRQQLRDKPDPPDVRVAVLLGEPEPLREVRPDLVTVENLDPEAGLAQALRDRQRQRGLPGSRETREPDDEPLSVF